MGRALTLFLFLAIAVSPRWDSSAWRHTPPKSARRRSVSARCSALLPAASPPCCCGTSPNPVAIAFLLSVPIAYGLATHWLQEFAYRVEIGVGLFLLSGALCPSPSPG